MSWDRYSRFSGIKVSQLNLDQAGRFEVHRLDSNPDRRIQEEWEQVVSSYSCKALSYPKDKLPAFSGLAAEFQKVMNDEYLACLWRGRLLEDLSWRRVTSSVVTHPHQPSRQPTSRPEWRCPSWLWMSIDGPIVYGSQGNPVSEIVECATLPLSELAPFGEITDGFLRINGPLSQVAVELERSTERPRFAFSESIDADLLLNWPSDGSAPN